MCVLSSILVCPFVSGQQEGNMSVTFVIFISSGIFEVCSILTANELPWCQLTVIWGTSGCDPVETAICNQTAHINTGVWQLRPTAQLLDQ